MIVLSFVMTAFHSSFVLNMSLYIRDLTLKVPVPKVPVHILHLENIVKLCFEDLREPKAPNSSPSQYQFIVKINLYCDMDEGFKPKVRKNTFLLLE
jgi:hypothetical protein